MRNQMRSEYTEVWNVDGEEIVGQQKAVFLPFKRVSSRAIIIRRKDAAILGTLQPGSMRDNPGSRRPRG